MKESSTEKHKPGRYLRASTEKRQRKNWNFVIIATVAVVVCVSLLLIFLLPQKSVYRTLRNDGYTGTQEQLVASLVGEEMAPQGDSAYAIAVANGYTKTRAEWIHTLTGAEATDENLSTYQVACANGFEGSLTHWLNHITEDPDALGKSGGKTPTEYELACEYGFSGTFIEWIVSLSSEHIY